MKPACAANVDVASRCSRALPKCSLHLAHKRKQCKIVDKVCLTASPCTCKRTNACLDHFILISAKFHLDSTKCVDVLRISFDIVRFILSLDYCLVSSASAFLLCFVLNFASIFLWAHCVVCRVNITSCI